MKKSIKTIAGLGLAAVMTFSACQLGANLPEVSDKTVSIDDVTALENVIGVSPYNASDANNASNHVSGYRYGSTKYVITHDLEAMKKINNDFVGWLTIKDTPIDIPIMQATDNKFYLTHDFYGNIDNTKVGCVFADYRNNLTKENRSQNVIVYGHNIRTGVGLAKITNYYPSRYGSLKFYTTHPTIKFETLAGGQDTYVVFAGMFVNTDKKHGDVFNYYKFRDFKSKNTFYQYFEAVFDRSVFYNPDLDIAPTDQFLTLSTCYYPMGAEIDTRFVVLARKVRKGEKVITSKNAYTNKSPLYFDYYYKANGGSWAGRKWSDNLMVGYKEWKEEQAEKKAAAEKKNG